MCQSPSRTPDRSSTADVCLHTLQYHRCCECGFVSNYYFLILCRMMRLQPLRSIWGAPARTEADQTSSGGGSAGPGDPERSERRGGAQEEISRERKTETRKWEERTKRRRPRGDELHGAVFCFVNIKEVVYQEINILLFTFPRVIPNLYDWLSGTQNVLGDFLFVNTLEVSGHKMLTLIFQKYNILCVSFFMPVWIMTELSFLGYIYHFVF